MTDVLLSGLVEIIMENLNSLIQEGGFASWSYKKDLKRLKRTLSTIKDVLQEAEEQQIRSVAMRNWLTELKDAAYDADDLLDEYATEVLARSRKFQVRNAFSLLSRLAFHLKAGNRIKEIIETFDDIAAQRSKFHLKGAKLQERPDSDDRHHKQLFEIETKIYGRDGDKLKIVGMLMDGYDGRNPHVIPIIGMGGIGKTTLARLVYNDETVRSHFDLRIWVCVSEHSHQTTRPKQAIIESMLGKKCDITSMDGTINPELETILKGKRFLLVLDGDWSEDHEMWEWFIKVIWNCGAKGPKVIVTTRSRNVASTSHDVYPYLLGKLSNEDCWSLFKQRAFTMGREEEPNLIAIGKEIVKKCGGLPLAAKALGSLMRSKSEENQWLSIKESEIWNLPYDENVIMPALRLSYNHLPSHLKQCFAYCSIFPKGYEFEKDKLIWLWIANGFVPIRRRMTLEDVGNEIFNDLLMGLFFEDVQKNEDGKVTRCKMHDLMSDLAQEIMRNECSVTQMNDKTFNIEGKRHLCCDVRPLLEIPSSLYRAKSLRTFLLLSVSARYISSTVTPEIRNFRVLRVLVLSHTSIEDLPISTANLKHIRYLDLSYTLIKALPESFNTLHNLQTLLLECCQNLQKLPERLSDINGLRHINISGCQSLIHMPKQIGKLTCLQTLTDFIVGKNKGSCIGELQGLDIRGELHIRQLENVHSGRDAGQANLAYKKNIQSLGLVWNEDGAYSGRTDEDGAYSGRTDEEVLAALQPHPNLKKFQLKGYLGFEMRCWIKSSSIPKLVEISIVKCKKVECLPDLGKLPFLKVLFIEGMESLKNIGREFYGDDMSNDRFPSLKEFTLKDMRNLEEWQSWYTIPRLAKLIIRKCPKLRTMPHIPSLQEMVLKESNELLLSFVSNFTSLSSLHIGGFPEMTSLPQGMLQNLNLRSFKLEDCPKLNSLKLGNQPFTSMTVWNCPDLKSVSEDTRLEHSSVYEHKKIADEVTGMWGGQEYGDN
ncbi:putative disease resistance protein RGA3 isoform X1 [Cinnamomum micranthum f. kanehirae]|uniref:Putative disease resistance protein RGA3 isoform X1 n=1 Tax=Cinnamomum micranthum f. kanehirae TaxID=337451 RepID=A0A3S3NEU0_9MAGN|nr:putative disease resistance protein RGA3 isoform X1 [Cinnamomum micranthum f. kanehirae]